MLKSEQKKAYEIIMSGKDAFITGGAGTGKSYLLNKIILDLKRMGKQVLVCAPTGMAALNIDGATIHRTFGYGKEPCITEKFKLVIRAPKVIRSADVIIIDEISMCRMDMMDSIIASVDKAMEKSGYHIQLVVAGDFCQLPPILPEKSSDRVLLEKYYGQSVGPAYAFQATGWRDRFQPIVLKEIVRQENQEFARNLNLMRMCDYHCLEYINNNSAKMPIPDAISVYARNKDVEKANRTAFSKLDGDEYIFPVQIQGACSEVSVEDYGIPSEICIKRFAKVLMTANDMHGKFATIERLDQRIHYNKDVPLFYNGSQATVLDIYQDKCNSREDAILVEIKGGYTIWIKRQRHEVCKYIVTENNTIERKVLFTMWQFPIKLAYAVTVHRGQGQTYSQANIDPTSKMSGQAYVAISRVTDIKNLYLYNRITLSDLYLHPYVLEFYRHIGDDEYIPSWMKLQSDKTISSIEPQKLEVLPETDAEVESDMHITESAYTKKKSDKKSGRPARYPTGSKAVRIPKELVEPLEGVLQIICPKSGMNMEMLEKFISAIKEIQDD